MKFKIKDIENKKETITEIWLQEGESGEVDLYAGDNHRLMTFRNGKFLRRWGTCSKNCIPDIQVDGRGHILEELEEINDID